MIPPGSLLIFFGASLALALAPGPDNIFVLTQSALHGRAAGFFITLGLCTGLLFHTAGVAFGVAVLFQNSALAFTLLKALGAGYLACLAWRAFRSSPTTLQPGRSDRISRKALYFRGVLMNISNPKVALFFLAFLPQFADPARGSLTPQIFLLGAVFLAASLLLFGSIALGAGALGDTLNKSPAMQRIMNRIAGTVLLALAIRLAISTR